MTSLITSISAQRNQEMRDYAASRRRALGARRRRRTRSASSAATADRAFIRRLAHSGADRAALEALAGRDSAAAPSGEVIAAELDGRLVAAVSISGPVERLTRQPGRLHAGAVVAAANRLTEVLRRTGE